MAKSDGKISRSPLRQKLTREAALLIGLLFVGMLLLPVAVYLIGQRILGEFGGAGFSGFFGTLAAKLRSGDQVAWFLVLTPNLAVVVLRMMAWGWRATARRPA